MSSRKEPKAERFQRVAEARVNKIIKLVRLLGNCANRLVYEYRPDQVVLIFKTLQAEMNAARMRYYTEDPRGKKRFSLSEPQKFVPDDQLSVEQYLPDGTLLRAVPYDGGDYPCINIYSVSPQGEATLVCFAEYNPEQEDGHHLCIGAYQSHLEDTTYYQPYVAERIEDE